ncbi:MAG TPA: PilN domain-containing protein [Symbiobacteriaceae bacterium]|nr:PilN domain-containing protein [Symbiobacteriaceae bacterium]
MININLIIKERPKVNWRRVGAIALAGVVAVSFGLYAQSWWIGYRQVREEVAGLAPLEETYRKAIEQSGKLKEREAGLQQQEARLAQIGRNQAPFGQADVLNKVFAAAPPDVSVTEVSIDKEQALLLAGQAPDFEAAMRYLRTLQALPLLSSVEERKLSTVAKGVTTFTFAARVRREGGQ